MLVSYDFVVEHMVTDFIRQFSIGLKFARFMNEAYTLSGIGDGYHYVPISYKGGLDFLCSHKASVHVDLKDCSKEELYIDY